MNGCCSTHLQHGMKWIPKSYCPLRCSTNSIFSVKYRNNKLAIKCELSKINCPEPLTVKGSNFVVIQHLNKTFALYFSFEWEPIFKNNPNFILKGRFHSDVSSTAQTGNSWYLHKSSEKVFKPKMLSDKDLLKCRYWYIAM